MRRIAQKMKFSSTLGIWHRKSNLVQHWAYTQKIEFSSTLGA